LHQQLVRDIFTKGVPAFWASQGDTINSGAFGEMFFKSLLEQHSQLIDYFSQTDMDALAMHFTRILDLLAKSVQKFGTTGHFRDALDRLGEIHRQRKIPTYTYALFGGHLLDSLQKYFLKEERQTKESNYPVTAKQLTQAYAVLFTELMSIVYYPMLLEEKKIYRARDFY
jgi:hemoglobin-like flavoprotein